MIPEYGNKEGRYAKLLVEVDLMKPLIRGSKLRCNGDTRWIEFKYENLSFFFYCGFVGHGNRMCNRKKEDGMNAREQADQFGEWLRVVKGRGFTKARNWGGRTGGGQEQEPLRYNKGENKRGLDSAQEGRGRKERVGEISESLKFSEENLEEWAS